MMCGVSVVAVFYVTVKLPLFSSFSSSVMCVVGSAAADQSERPEQCGAAAG